MGEYNYEKKIALSVALLLTLSCVNTNFSAEALSNGKKYEQFPVTKEVKEMQSERQELAKYYAQYKDGKISSSEYLQKELKSNEILKNKLQNKLQKSSLSILDLSNMNDESVERLISDITSGSARAASNRISDLVHQPQINSYYCGPATAAMIIKARAHASYTQGSLANSLRTTTAGTAWYDGGGRTGYPMADTINDKINENHYIPYGTYVQAQTFKSDVVYDIDRDYGVAGNAWQVEGGFHLNGHPNQTIFHWFAIDGYYNYGNDIWYVDPASGASSISWSGNVPAYSSLSYTILATIVDGRGIIW